MPDNFSIATLFPDCAMRVSRLALPLSDVLNEENVSDCRVFQISNYTRICVTVGIWVDMEEVNVRSSQ
jgi:hypothetical protein